MKKTFLLFILFASLAGAQTKATVKIIDTIKLILPNEQYLYECDIYSFQNKFILSEWQTGQSYFFDSNFYYQKTIERSEKSFVFNFKNVLRFLFASRNAFKQTELLRPTGFVDFGNGYFGLKSQGNVFLYDSTGSFKKRLSLSFGKYYCSSSLMFYDIKKKLLIYPIEDTGNLWDMIKTNPDYYKTARVIGTSKLSAHIYKNKNIKISNFFGKYDSVYFKHKYLPYLDNSTLYYDSNNQLIFSSFYATCNICVYDVEGNLLKSFGVKGKFAQHEMFPTMKNQSECTEKTVAFNRLTTNQYLNIYHDSKTGYTFRLYTAAVTDTMVIKKLQNEGALSGKYAINEYKNYYMQVYDKSDNLVTDIPVPNGIKFILQINNLLYVNAGFVEDKKSGKYYNTVYVYQIEID